MRNFKYFLPILSLALILSYPSDWDSDGDGLFDNISDYQNSGSITSSVLIDGENSGSSGDALAAFVNGEQRGFQGNLSVPFGPYAGTEMFPILIYSNASSGETILFQFYDAETDSVYDIEETIDFSTDMTVGNFVTPQFFNVSGGGSGDPTDGCELPENTIFLTSDGDVIYNIPTDFAGLQFNIDGTTASSASGGEAAGAGWILQASGSTVLGFSFSNVEITTDCGLLLSLSLNGEATGLSSIVISDSSSQAIDVSYYSSGGDDGSCDDIDEDGVCDDVDDCVGQLDECGVCNGSGIPDGDCDCNANVEDCAGVCGGSAVNDECGVWISFIICCNNCFIYKQFKLSRFILLNIK